LSIADGRLLISTESQNWKIGTRNSITASRFSNSDFRISFSGQPAMPMAKDSEAPKSSSRVPPAPRRRGGAALEDRVVLMALAAGFPAFLVALILLWTGPHSSQTRWTLTIVLVVVWLGFSLALRGKVAHPLQTLSNLLSALREEDYSIRARGTRPGSALGEVFAEVNALSEVLRGQRLSSLEATALLRKVMEEIEVAIFTFDDEQRLRLLNRAGERLLAQPAERILGQTATELGLGACLEGEPVRTMTMSFPGDAGRWGIRRSTFREHGRPHQMLVLANLSQALREEERQAWQRLIRVLGHELNNSLAPIKSMAGTLGSLLTRQPRPADWEEDACRGLSVIEGRAESLSRFMEGYSRLARLPSPKLQPADLGALVRRVASLERRLPVTLNPGPELTLQADPDQLEQMLINLLRNAVDAALETGGGVKLGWRRNADYVELLVEDEGPGLPNTTNLFVPFFTTKAVGTGIGLVLSRQIAEAHGGSLTLQNRRSGQGCEARVRLPV
jgi:nitrogen fixation/metabolism regulation signal transduction histidine kinase